MNKKKMLRFVSQNHFEWACLSHFDMGEGVRDFDPPYA